MVGVANSDRATPTSTRRRVEPASLPTWVKPQLAVLVTRAPDGPDWLHEVKLDGYRMHARLDAGRVNFLTRRRNDWTDKYPAIAAAIGELRVQNAYLDGELCGVLPDGRTAFKDCPDTTRANSLADRRELFVIGSRASKSQFRAMSPHCSGMMPSSRYDLMLPSVPR